MKTRGRTPRFLILQQLQERTEEALSDFSSGVKKPMELVMFMCATAV